MPFKVELEKKYRWASQHVARYDSHDRLDEIGREAVITSELHSFLSTPSRRTVQISWLPSYPNLGLRVGIREERLVDP